MKIYTVPDGQLDMNGYIVTKNGREAILIDCGGSLVFEKAKELNLKITHLLLTHGHFDHMIGCMEARQQGIKIGILEQEVENALSLKNEIDYCALPKERAKVQAFMEQGKFDFTYQDGEKLHIADMDITVYATAGHTSGSCCLLIENHLFTGDTLFYECVGRTDLSTGNLAELKKSIDKLLELSPESIVYPGHGWTTTIGHERERNPLSNYRIK